MSYVGSNYGLPSLDLMMEKMEAQQIERRYFGNSVLAEVQGDLTQINRPNYPPQQYPQMQKPSNSSTDGKDDGKIPFKEKVENFGKGLIKPIKTMLSSPKNIVITAATILAGSAIIAATGGVAAPIFVAAGLVGGTLQIGKGIHRQANAKTDLEAKNAWQDMGSGTFTVGVSAMGAKSCYKRYKANLNATSPVSPAGGGTSSTGSTNSTSSAGTSSTNGTTTSSSNSGSSSSSSIKGTVGRVSQFIKNLWSRIFGNGTSSNNATVPPTQTGNTDGDLLLLNPTPNTTPPIQYPNYGVPPLSLPPAPQYLALPPAK